MLVLLVCPPAREQLLHADAAVQLEIHQRQLLREDVGGNGQYVQLDKRLARTRARGQRLGLVVVGRQAAKVHFRPRVGRGQRVPERERVLLGYFDVVDASSAVRAAAARGRGGGGGGRGPFGRGGGIDAQRRSKREDGASVDAVRVGRDVQRLGFGVSALEVDGRWFGD